MNLLIHNNFNDLPRQPKIGGAVLMNGQYVEDTYRCVHCSAAWRPRPGSGTKRGYCRECKGLLCGQPICMDRCVPLELRLQGMEMNLTHEQSLERLSRLSKTIAL